MIFNGPAPPKNDFFAGRAPSYIRRGRIPQKKLRNRQKSDKIDRVYPYDSLTFGLFFVDSRGVFGKKNGFSDQMLILGEVLKKNRVFVFFEKKRDFIRNRQKSDKIDAHSRGIQK